MRLPCVRVKQRLGSPDAELIVPQPVATASPLSQDVCAQYGAVDDNAVRYGMLRRCACALSMPCS